MKLFAVLLVLSTFLTLGLACCSYNGTCYSHGNKINGGCINFTCKSNTWTFDNFNKDCRRCTINSEWTHTFDTHLYPYNGTCNYTLTQDLKYPVPFGYNPKFGIFTNFELCPGGRCFEETTYKVDAHTIVTVNHQILQDFSKIKINNVWYDKNGPFLPSLPLIGAPQGTWAMHLQGPEYAISFYSSTMVIRVPPSQLEGEVGLCGYYNNNAAPLQEYLMRGGEFTDDPSIFAPTWLTNAQNHACCYSKQISSSPAKSRVRRESPCSSSAANNQLCADALTPFVESLSTETYNKLLGVCLDMLCDGTPGLEVTEIISEMAKTEVELNEGRDLKGNRGSGARVFGCGCGCGCGCGYSRNRIDIRIPIHPRTFTDGN